jgi:hypothetical protein
MGGADVANKIIGLVLSAIAGVISFFLKRTIDRVDQNEKAIAAIRDGFAKRTEASSASAMSKMEARMNERLDSIDSELKAVRTQYITKDEFVTQIAKLTAQNDRIYDMLFDLARKGGA